MCLFFVDGLESPDLPELVEPLCALGDADPGSDPQRSRFSNVTATDIGRCRAALLLSSLKYLDFVGGIVDIELENLCIPLGIKVT